MPETVICRYQLKPDAWPEFHPLLDRHWQTLNQLELVTSTSRQVFKAIDAPMVVEIFEWKTADAVRIAHESPAILSLWEPMGKLCAGMEFKPHFDPVAV